MAKGRRASTRANQRQSRYRRNTNFVALPVDVTKSLLALAADGVDKGDVMTSPFEHNIRIISVDLMWMLRQFTPGEGPVEVGLAHGDYTTTEIKETLDLELLGPARKIEQERAGRLIRRVLSFPGASADEVRPETGHLRTRLNWKIQSGEDLEIWAAPRGGITLTTGAQLKVTGTLYGVWY